MRAAKEQWTRALEARACKCSPTVYAVIDGQWAKVGYLDAGWKARDLDPFAARLVEMRNKYAAGEQWQPRKMPRLAEYAETWFSDLYAAAEAGGISKLTYNTYDGVWHNHLAPVFGNLPLAAIDARALQRFVRVNTASGYKAVTVNSWITPLSAMLSDAEADGLIARNPCRSPRRGRHGGRNAVLATVDENTPKHLEIDEARALIAVTPREYRAMVLAALTTGARRSELYALRWEDIDLASMTVAIDGQLLNRERVRCKYESERKMVPLYSGLAAMLGPRRQAEGYVFLAPDGRPWNSSETNRAFLNDAYAAAGIARPTRPWHALRHTYKSVLIAGGIREDVADELMGHKPQGVAASYTHRLKDAYSGVEAVLEAAFGVNHTSMEGCVPNVLDRHRLAA
jgi:integrase